jgi:hypothetical protein
MSFRKSAPEIWKVWTQLGIIGYRTNISKNVNGMSKTELKTAKSHNSQLTGEIELPTYPSSVKEFSETTLKMVIKYLESGGYKVTKIKQSKRKK